MACAIAPGSNVADAATCNTPTAAASAQPAAHSAAMSHSRRGSSSGTAASRPRGPSDPPTDTAGRRNARVPVVGLTVTASPSRVRDAKKVAMVHAARGVVQSPRGTHRDRPRRSRTARAREARPATFRHPSEQRSACRPPTCRSAPPECCQPATSRTGTARPSFAYSGSTTPLDSALHPVRRHI